MKATLTGRDAVEAADSLRPVAQVPRRTQVHFFELVRTGCPLLDAGVILRKRSWAGRLDEPDGDSAVILRPFRRSGLPEHWFNMTRDDEHMLTVTGDWSVRNGSPDSDTRVESATLVHRWDRRNEGRSAWSEKQRALVADYTRMSVPFDDLVVRGPVDVRSWTTDLDGLLVTVQHWKWPGTVAVEIALSTELHLATLVVPLLLSAVEMRGWDAASLAYSKTRLVLEGIVG